MSNTRSIISILGVSFSFLALGYSMQNKPTAYDQEEVLKITRMNDSTAVNLLHIQNNLLKTDETIGHIDEGLERIHSNNLKMKKINAKTDILIKEIKSFSQDRPNENPYKEMLVKDSSTITINKNQPSL